MSISRNETRLQELIFGSLNEVSQVSRSLKLKKILDKTHAYSDLKDLLCSIESPHYTESVFHRVEDQGPITLTIQNKFGLICYRGNSSTVQKLRCK